jgi:hypothetical protein
MAPQKSECPAGAGQIAEQSADAPIVPSCGDEHKQLAGVKAAFAMAGHTVHELSGGGFLVARWGLAKECPSLFALKHFARQIGVST